MRGAALAVELVLAGCSFGDDDTSTTVIDVELRELLRSDYIILIRPVGQESVLTGICGDTALAEENA